LRAWEGGGEGEGGELHARLSKSPYI
jgi:hypothetical protein